MESEEHTKRTRGLHAMVIHRSHCFKGISSNSGTFSEGDSAFLAPLYGEMDKEWKTLMSEFISHYRMLFLLIIIVSIMYEVNINICSCN